MLVKQTHRDASANYLKKTCYLIVATYPRCRLAILISSLMRIVASGCHRWDYVIWWFDCHTQWGITTKYITSTLSCVGNVKLTNKWYNGVLRRVWLAGGNVVSGTKTHVCTMKLSSDHNSAWRDGERIENVTRDFRIFFDPTEAHVRRVTLHRTCIRCVTVILSNI